MFYNISLRPEQTKQTRSNTLYSGFVGRFFSEVTRSINASLKLNLATLILE